MLRQQAEKVGLNASEAQVLSFVAENGNKSITEIASSLNLGKSSVADIIDSLEKKGLVRRVRSLNDKRVVYVEVTNKGKELYSSIKCSYRDLILNLLSQVKSPECVTSFFEVVIRYSSEGEKATETVKITNPDKNNK